jgi:NAD(P)-dependent dehydrogenase (short-subunit alcohol dehydrogenase family)
MLLKDKVILVTGSTQGIGAAIVRLCVREGAKVMLHGRSEQRAKELQVELGDNTSYHLCALDDVAALAGLVDATVEKFGRLDALVNNAAIYPRNTLESLDEEFFDRVVDINMKAPIFLCKYALEAFRKNNPSTGNIVNIGSINAYSGETEMSVYPMTKGALMTMTRNLADTHGPENIRVNQLNLGWVLTDNESQRMIDEGYPADWESQIDPMFAPRGTLLRPEECAEHVIFWLSDRSAPANGQVYEVEQYPLAGRNMISQMRDRCIKKTGE